MNKQEANEKISNNLEQMNKLFEECKVLAKEHALEIEVSFPGAEDAGFDINYNINDSYEFESFIEDLEERVKKGRLSEEDKNRLIEEKKKKFRGCVNWHSSSLSCALAYDESEKDFED